MMTMDSIDMRKKPDLRNKRLGQYCLPGISRWCVPFLLLAVMASFVYAADRNAAADSEQMQTMNVFCPVMPDMKTVPGIFTDHQGKRVYFCCVNCRAAFGRTPEKYLGRLPQFGGTPTQTGHEHEHGSGSKRFIKPIGIITLSLLVLTAVWCLFRKKVPKFLLRRHKRLGMIALISAFTHAILVLIAH